MKRNQEILNIASLEMFERMINRDLKPYDVNMMVMPGTLEDKHKNCETIPALRRQFNLIYLLLEGEHDVRLGADHLQLKPNDLVIVPENTLYASDHIKNCHGYCIHFKSEFLKPQLSKSLTEEFPFFHFDAPHIINLNDQESEMIQSSFKNIIEEYNRFSPEKNFLLCNLILILLLRVREIYRTKVKELNKNTSRREQLANGFKLLVEKHFIENRTVSLYAEMLYISAKHLSEVVSETFGRPPLQIIHDILVLEAKVQLGSTDKSISEIAYSLKFDDPSHFTHFIKKRTGLSPQDFRRKL
ncbi:MAG: AraC family transcriptional regulator [Saprospiraceae bacterium]|nr:AraC family transcriptional regulator [Saprospiraceae bacterium]MBK7812028.1 AraC family transcriptional regulator [Saprospiraceae bacterium]MBK9632766.1 AraC family transcriptional regulator [Saprospiraceae bacterium]